MRGRLNEGGNGLAMKGGSGDKFVCASNPSERGRYPELSWALS